MMDDKNQSERRKKPAAMVNFNIFNEVCAHHVSFKCKLLIYVSHDVAFLNRIKKSQQRKSQYFHDLNHVTDQILSYNAEYSKL